MFAAVSFVHLDWSFTKGQEVPVDHPMVALRPDLFSDIPPAKGSKTPKE